MSFINETEKKVLGGRVSGMLLGIGFCVFANVVFFVFFRRLLLHPEDGSHDPLYILGILVDGGLSVFGVILSVSLIKRVVSCRRDVTEAFSRLGDPDRIGREIAAIPSYTGRVSGELRFNGRLLFYRNSVDIRIVETEEIAALKAGKQTKGSWYVCVVLKSGEEFKIACDVRKAMCQLGADIKKAKDGSLSVSASRGS